MFDAINKWIKSLSGSPPEHHGFIQVLLFTFVATTAGYTITDVSDHYLNWLREPFGMFVVYFLSFYSFHQNELLDTRERVIFSLLDAILLLIIVLFIKRQIM